MERETVSGPRPPSTLSGASMTFQLFSRGVRLGRNVAECASDGLFNYVERSTGSHYSTTITVPPSLPVNPPSQESNQGMHSQSFSKLQLGMVLQKLVNAFSRRKNKKEGEIPAPSVDFLSLPNHKLKPIVSFPKFPKAPPSFSPKVADYDNNAYFEEFDGEGDNAKVNAYASQTAPVFNSPAKHCTLQSWLARSPDIRPKICSLQEAEAVFARHQAERLQSQQSKPSKSWKRLLFWKRSKKTVKFEFNPKGLHSSSTTTPQHHMFKSSSRTRATVAPSFISAPYRDSMPKRFPSSPIYYDGTPLTPSRSNRPFSSPLSGCSTPSKDGLHDSTYMPLKRPYSKYRTCASPLYIP